MPSIFSPLILLLLTTILIEPTSGALPAYLQNLELDDVTSLWDKFPLIIGQIKQAVNRFRCPKGWRRLGGSCYYLSNVTSVPSEANQTCNQLHSNYSNLMQIRHTVELVYAAHVLTKNGLNGLMIEIDPNLLKGKTVAEFLMDDPGRWQRMKEKFREVRIRYYKLKEKVLDELNAAGLRISRKSKKIKQSVKKRKDKFIEDHTDTDVNDDDYHENNRTDSQANSTTVVDEYEYDDLDSEDGSENFEQLDDIQGICDRIDWNVLNNNASVYLLTTFLVDDKIVCSLSNVEEDIEYDHVCEYVLDFCFANIVCGKHGRCVNTLSGFKCSCSFLYGGILCERISRQGKQIIIGIVLVIVLYGLSLQPVRVVVAFLIKGSIEYCKLRRRHKKAKKEERQQLVSSKKVEDDDDDDDEEKKKTVQDERRQTIAEEIMDFLREIRRCITTPKSVHPLANPNKRDLTRISWVGGLSIICLTLLLSITTITHFTSFKYDVVNETKLNALINETVYMLAKCGKISNYRLENLIFFPVALALIIVFSWSIKREKKCRHLCDGRPGLIAPIEPFRTANRFTTATVFGILAFEVLKIFEELLFSTVDPLGNRGILIELIERVAMVLMIGLRYYPVLASLQLRNVAVRFFACLYVLMDIVYTIIREGACMGFLPLSGYYTTLEEATLRMEIGTWFIIYGLVKNTPHFILLSYICSELCVRFAYDSIYVPLKKKQSIWSNPVAQPDESAFAKYYVTKLFRRNVRANEMIYSTKVDESKMEDYQHEMELQREANSSRVKKFFNSIYHWDDDFRFTTMATCTYTVAIIFLYYLACTLVFLYISRTTGHISFIRSFIETTFDIEFHGFFSLRSTIIISAFIAVGIFAFQLYLGMQNYKKHKLQLLKGIFEDVPSASNFNPTSIAAKSVHYSGFLVGYMAWGFVICFHIIFFFLSIIRILSLQIRYIEVILAVTVPVLVLYLLKMTSTSSAGKFLFIQSMEEKLNLKNRKVYAIFLYFNFFADCFLGIASCIIRLIKASALNLVYMARLDCSFLGRPLEKFDLGFAAYVSYLHMEVTHTNPIMLAFCYSLYDDVVKRRLKRCYDDECCIAPGELDDDDLPMEYKPMTIETVSSKTSGHSTNGSVSKTTKVNSRETVVPPVVKKQKSIDIKDDDDDDDGDGSGPSLEEVKPKTKSRSPSIASEKSNQKAKSKKLSIDDNLEEDDGPPPPEVSTIARLIPLQQPHLPSPSAPFPDVPIRQDLPHVAKHDDDDDDDDDGGMQQRSSIGTVSKLIPEEPPRLLPIQGSSPPPVPSRQDAVSEKEDEEDDGGMGSRKSTKPKEKSEKKKTKKEETKKTKHQHDDDDDDDDDDGGLQPPSITTISKIMPQHPPRLPPAPSAASVQRPPLPITTKPASGSVPKSPMATFQQASRPMVTQHSGPPPTPKRQDLPPTDDDEDDGGISSKVIAKQKQELEKKKKKKEESKKKKPLDDDDDDDDDGGVPKSKKDDKKKSKEKNKSKVPLIFEDEDDDGGVSKETRIAAERKKKELEAKKKTKEQIKMKVKQEDGEDDDGGVSKETRLVAEKKKQELEAKKKAKEQIKAKVKADDDEDEDGGRALKTFDTVKIIMPSKQPVLRHQTNKTPSPEAMDDGSMLSSRAAQEPLLKSYNVVGRIVPNLSANRLKMNEENHYDTIPTDEDRVVGAQPTYSPPSYEKAANSADLNLLRTISYREATENASPTIERRPTGSSVRSHSKSTEGSSHYSEITSNSTSTGVINRSYSHSGSIQSASNNSIKQQGKPPSEHTLKEEQQTEESTVESEGETEEEEEEEDDEEVAVEKEEPKERPTKAKTVPHSSTAYMTIAHLVNPDEAAELKRIAKRKQARFRWFLAYTIINNYHLFDLRKQAQGRLARLRIERSNLIDEQQAAAMAAQQPGTEAVISGSPGIRLRGLKVATPILPTTPGQRSPGIYRLLSVPVPVFDDYPQSPAERYVAIRSSMLYDVNTQQTDTSRSPGGSQIPSTVNQQVTFSGKSNTTPRNISFRTMPTVIVEPPSDSTTLSRSKRPSYYRQETEYSDPLLINQFDGSPTFQAIPESSHSIADYPMTNDSTTTNLSTLRTQMSHTQRMQAWRLKQEKKLQKKRPHCYHYGPPLQRPLEEKVATATILTPQILPTVSTSTRPPSNPVFSFPRHVQIINETKKNNQRKPGNPTTSSSSNPDEKKQEKFIKKKSLRTTATFVQRRDSQNSVSNVTEV